MAFALLPGIFKVFARSRWTGADLVLDQLGIMESCHGLLREVFSRTQCFDVCLGLGCLRSKPNMSLN